MGTGSRLRCFLYVRQMEKQEVGDILYFLISGLCTNNIPQRLASVFSCIGKTALRWHPMIPLKPKNGY